MANYPTGLNGWLYMTQTEYNGITHDANTKYTVRNGNSVTEYLGDVMIVSEEGDSWVTMAKYLIDQQAMQDVITAINDRVTALETWKTSTVTPFINDITGRVAALESADATVTGRISAIETWQVSANAILEALQATVSALQANAVTSADIRIIDKVSSIPASPSESTLYIVAGD